MSASGTEVTVGVTFSFPPADSDIYRSRMKFSTEVSGSLRQTFVETVQRAFMDEYIRVAQSLESDLRVLSLLDVRGCIKWKRGDILEEISQTILVVLWYGDSEGAECAVRYQFRRKGCIAIVARMKGVPESATLLDLKALGVFVIDHSSLREQVDLQEERLRS